MKVVHYVNSISCHFHSLQRDWGSTLSIIPDSSSNSRPKKLKDACKWVVKASMKVIGSIREAPLMEENKKCEIIQRKLRKLKYF